MLCLSCCKPHSDIDAPETLDEKQAEPIPISGSFVHSTPACTQYIRRDICLNYQQARVRHAESSAKAGFGCCNPAVVVRLVGTIDQ